MTKSFFKEALFHCFSSSNFSIKLVEFLTIRFPQFLIDNEDDILDHCRNVDSRMFYAFSNNISSKMTEDEIFEMLLVICKYKQYDTLVKNINIISKYINVWRVDCSLISVAIDALKILKFLLDFPSLNYEYKPGKRLEFYFHEANLFYFVINNPRIDLNCTEYHENYEITLLMFLVLNDDYRYFGKVLQKPNIDVNYMIKVRKDESSEFIPYYSLIHYLSYQSNEKMLKLLMNYPTIDVNILTADGLTPYDCSPKHSEARSILERDSRVSRKNACVEDLKNCQSLKTVAHCFESLNKYFWHLRHKIT